MDEREMRRKKRKKRRIWRVIKEGLLIAVMVLTVIMALKLISNDHEFEQLKLPVFTNFFREASVDKKLADFAEEHNLTLDAWPDEMVELMKNNPETETFVLNYPLKKDQQSVADLSACVNTKEVPRLYQWDLRWGYKMYSGDVMGLTGCGPTCLSMVSLYLLDDVTYTPAYIADYSAEHGYSVEGSGSAWALISEGGKELGLDVVEIPLNEQRVIENLEVGNPIICIMGPGEFTTSGHFIVLAGYEDGKIIVNDPNSKSRSEKEWGYDEICDQIRGLWVCRK